MPKNPFGQEDPLGGSGSANNTNVFGAAAAGFGQVQKAATGFGQSQQAAGAGGEDYEVVEITEDQPAPAAASTSKAQQSSHLSTTHHSTSRSRSIYIDDDAVRRIRTSTRDVTLLTFDWGTGGGGILAGVLGGAKKSEGPKDLAAREAELAKREQELRRKEAALAAAGGAVNPRQVANFPPCLPIVHHDINNDIPEYNKGIMRAGFMVFMCTILALIWNLVGVVIGTIASSDVSIASCFFAILYVVIGVPGAWYTWYGRLYTAMQTDGALSFAGFFFTFFIHTAFAIWSAVSPDLTNGMDYAHTGWLPALALFKGDSRFTGILYMVGAAMWSAVAFLSVTYMGRVYSKMRGGNLTERARQEAMQMGAQMAAQEMTRKHQQGR